MKPKTNPQKDCIEFDAALSKMNILRQPRMLVKYFKIVVVSPKGNKLTLSFDPVAFAKKKASKP